MRAAQGRRGGSSATPLISVVIPTRNRWPLVLRTLSTALGQEDVDLEVIVVDDGSTDGTPSGLAELADPRVRAVHHRTCRGLPRARNTGISEARGEWLAFLDDDDLWAPRKLRAQLDVALKAGAGYAYAAAVHLREPGVALRLHPPPPPEDVARRLLGGNVMPAGASNVIARTDLIRALGGFDEELPHLADWDLWIRLAHAAAGAPCPDVLVGYVDHPGNMFKSAGDAVMTEYDRIVAKHRAAREASGVKAGEVHFSRAIALMHLRAGRRLRASRAYLRGAVAHRSTGNLIRAGAALLGEDLMSRFSRDRALAAEEPAWVRLVWTAPSTRGPQPRRSVDGSAEPRPSEERRVGTATRSGSGS